MPMKKFRGALLTLAFVFVASCAEAYQPPMLPPMSGLSNAMNYACGITIGDGKVHTVGNAPSTSCFYGKTTLAQLAAININGQQPFFFLTDNGSMTGPLASYPQAKFVAGSGASGTSPFSFTASTGGCTTYPVVSVAVTSGAISSATVTTAGLGCSTSPTITNAQLTAHYTGITGASITVQGETNPFTETNGVYQLTNSSVANLDIAWLAIEAAILDQPVGAAYVPGGHYVIGSSEPLPLMLPIHYQAYLGQVVNNTADSIWFVGDGEESTVLIAGSSFGFLSDGATIAPLLSCGDPAAVPSLVAANQIGRYDGQYGQCQGTMALMGFDGSYTISGTTATVNPGLTGTGLAQPFSITQTGNIVTATSSFTGSALNWGLYVGKTIYGSGITPEIITAITSLSGSNATLTVNQSQTIGSSTTVYAQYLTDGVALAARLNVWKVESDNFYKDFTLQGDHTTYFSMKANNGVYGVYWESPNASPLTGDLMFYDFGASGQTFSSIGVDGAASIVGQFDGETYLNADFYDVIGEAAVIPAQVGYSFLPGSGATGSGTFSVTAQANGNGMACTTYPTFSVNVSGGKINSVAYTANGAGCVGGVATITNAEILTAGGSSATGLTGASIVAGAQPSLSGATNSGSYNAIIGQTSFERLMTEYNGVGVIQDDTGFNRATGQYTDAAKARAVNELKVLHWFNLWGLGAGNYNSSIPSYNTGTTARRRRATIDVQKITGDIRGISEVGGIYMPVADGVTGNSQPSSIAFINSNLVWDSNDYLGLSLSGDMYQLFQEGVGAGISGATIPVIISGYLLNVDGTGAFNNYGVGQQNIYVGGARWSEPGLGGGIFAFLNFAGNYTSTSYGDVMEASGTAGWAGPAGALINAPVLGIAMQSGLGNFQTAPLMQTGVVNVNTGGHIGNNGGYEVKSTGIAGATFTAGTGATLGSYLITATGGGCTTEPAVYAVVGVNGGGITSIAGAFITTQQTGVGCTSAPTFSTSSITGLTGGSITAKWPSGQMAGATAATAGSLGHGLSTSTGNANTFTANMTTRLQGLQ